MKGFNPNQLNLNFEAPPPGMVQQDLQGRTLTDIKKASKSYNEQVLKSITLKNGHWYIEGKDADEWIALYNSLDEKTSLADY